LFVPDRARITPRLVAAENIEDRDAAEKIDAKLAADPMLSADAADPIDPIDRTDPTDPIDSTEPFEPMHRIESSDHSDHFERFPTGSNVGSGRGTDYGAQDVAHAGTHPRDGVFRS
jgi:hypothetical protein